MKAKARALLEWAPIALLCAVGLWALRTEDEAGAVALFGMALLLLGVRLVLDAVPRR